MNVRSWIYRFCVFVWCFIGCSLWAGYTVLAAPVLATSSDVPINIEFEDDGTIKDGMVIDDVSNDEGITIYNVTQKVDLAPVNRELASMSNALSVLKAAAQQNAHGNVSSSVVQIFDRVVMSLKPTDHYVLIRESNYGYRLYFGDLRLNGGVFSGMASNVYYYTGDYNTSSYLQINSGRSDISVSPGTYLSYSDLGHYPRLGVNSDEDKAFHLLCAVAFAYAIIWQIFSICRYSLKK